MLSWRSLTTGGFSGIDTRLRDPRAGVLKIETPVVSTEIAVDQIGREPVVVENGGIRRRLQVYRLPDENPAQRMQARVRVPLHTARTMPCTCASRRRTDSSSIPARSTWSGRRPDRHKRRKWLAPGRYTPAVSINSADDSRKHSANSCAVAVVVSSRQYRIASPSGPSGGSGSIRIVPRCT